LGCPLFQKGIHAESSPLSTSGSYPPSKSSRKAKITATIICEEAAERLLHGIQADGELAALAQVLNRYKIQEWLKHVNRVGADQVIYWREQLGEEIMAAMRSKNSPSQRKKFPWCFFRSFSASVKYDVADLHLDPLSIGGMRDTSAPTALSVTFA
jgi:hypothetical protein